MGTLSFGDERPKTNSRAYTRALPDRTAATAALSKGMSKRAHPPHTCSYRSIFRAVARQSNESMEVGHHVIVVRELVDEKTRETVQRQETQSFIVTRRQAALTHLDARQ